METKLWGIILSVLGIAGLIIALLNIYSVDDHHQNILIVSGILGAIAFFAGIRLIPDAKRIIRK